MKAIYKIQITRIDETEEDVTKTFLIEEKPTGVTKSGTYRDEVIYEKKWEARDTTETKRSETTILSQTIEDLDLVAIISAINGIGLGGKSSK